MEKIVLKVDDLSVFENAVNAIATFIATNG